MAKCTVCRKQFSAPFWKFASLCPECIAANQEMHTKLKGLTPVFIVTPCLVAINVVVFAAMVVCGVSIMDPDLSDLIRWGADYGALTLGPQPWRLLTAMFLHIGLIHLGFNMWCLWSLGRLAERLMGNLNFLVLYLLSGVGGGLLSLWLHPQLVSAGASGAIFGVAGGIVTLLVLKKAQIPGPAMKQTLNSMLLFIGYNLLYGMRGGIDNAAHLGGLLSGAALGAFVPERVLGDASPTASSALAQEPSSPMFKFAAVALACFLMAGYGYVRRSHGAVAGQESSVDLDLFALGKDDRTNLQESAKLVESGQADDSTIDKLRAVTLHVPSSGLAHIVLAEAYVQKAKYSEAIPEYRKAIALKPNYAPSHFELGSALLQNGQNDQAIEEYHTALRLDPNNANARNNLGVALERTGDAKGALEEYSQAHTLAPKDETFNRNFNRLSNSGKN